MRDLRLGTTGAILLSAAALLAGCTQNFWEATPFGEALQYEHPRVTARKGVMRENLKQLRAIQAAVKAGNNAATAKAARDLAANAKRLSQAFRRMTLAGKTTARPVVWQKKTEFDQGAANLVTSAEVLALAAEGGDKAGIANGFATAAASCDSCHKVFRTQATNFARLAAR